MSTALATHAVAVAFDAMPGRPENLARRDAIADAVLDVLGREGSRGLTHRAVDQSAGLASGSTVYYCRSRADLVALGAERLSARDKSMIDTLQHGRTNRRSTPLQLLASMVRAWLTGDARVTTRARLELFMMSRTDPGLLTTLHSIRLGFTDMAALVTSNRADAEFVVSALDGIVLSEICFGAPEVTARHAAQLVAPLAPLLRQSFTQ